MKASDQGSAEEFNGTDTRPFRALLDPERFQDAARRAHDLTASSTDSTTLKSNYVELKVGAYVLRERLGQGGMGDVFRATRDDGEEFALKILSKQLVRDVDAQLRFRREIRTLAALSRTRGIVRVHDAGITPDLRPYFVMDYVAGSTSLAQALRAGLPAEDALLMLVRVADVLGQAHRLDLIHRDIKPSNILVTSAGEVLLIDFGLAKIMPEADHLTATGDVLGTPRYMSPEQARGDQARVGIRSDVYGLGAILYEILSGGFTPFHEVPPGSLLFHIGNGSMPLPPSKRGPTVDPRLEAICMKALDPAPEQRQAHACLFADALDRALHDEPLEEELPPSPPKREWRVPWAPLGWVSLVAVGWALGWVTRGPDQDAAVPSPTPTAPTEASQVPTPTPPRGPGWFRGLPLSQRPPSLPAGVRFGGEDERHEYVNEADGSVMVWVPAGTFVMGRDDGPEEEGPARSVSLRGFFMGKYEVTWAQMNRFTREAGAKPRSPIIAAYGTEFEAGDQHPVFDVSWNDARAYCEYYGLRLPTEAEWECAAKGSDARIFPWGDTPPLGTSAQLNLADRTAEHHFEDVEQEFGVYQADYDDGYFYPSPVGSFPKGASPFGCLDMAGNVCEFTSDRAGRHGSTEVGEKVVIRGGAWEHPLRFCRTTWRGEMSPEVRNTWMGFRVCRYAD